MNERTGSDMIDGYSIKLVQSTISENKNQIFVQNHCELFSLLYGANIQHQYLLKKRHDNR